MFVDQLTRCNKHETSSKNVLLRYLKNSILCASKKYRDLYLFSVSKKQKTFSVFKMPNHGATKQQPAIGEEISTEGIVADLIEEMLDQIKMVEDLPNLSPTCPKETRSKNHQKRLSN